MEGTYEGESSETDRQKKERKNKKTSHFRGEGKIGVENGEVTAARERES